MMKQAHVAEYYTAYLDGSLPETLRQEVEAHLHACPQCAAELDDLRRMLEDLATLPVPPLPADFTAGVRARIAQRSRRPALRWRIPALAGGALAAATALMLVLSQAIYTPQGADLARQPEQARTRAAAPEQDGAADTREIATTPVDPFAQPPSADAQQAPATPLPSAKAGRHAAGMHRDTAFDAAEKPAGTKAMPATPATPIVVALAPPPEQTMKWASPAPEALRGGPTGPTGEAGYEKSGSAVRNGGATVMAADAVPDAHLQTNMTTTPPAHSSTQEAPAAASAINTGKAAADGNYIRLRAVTVGTPVTNGYATFQRDDGLKIELHAKDGSALRTQNVDGAALSVTGAGGNHLSISYADMPTSQAQQVALPNTPADVLLQLPALPNGAALKLALTDQGHAFYLILPGNGPRQEKTSIQITGQSRLSALQQLARAGGFSLLCPAAFADEKATFTVTDATPRAALEQLAAQAKFRLEVNGNVVNLVK